MGVSLTIYFRQTYEYPLYLIHKRIMNSPKSTLHGCEFLVLHATRSVHSVKLEEETFCNCPNATKGHISKHLQFLMLHVLNLQKTNI